MMLPQPKLGHLSNIDKELMAKLQIRTNRVAADPLNILNIVLVKPDVQQLNKHLLDARSASVIPIAKCPLS
ncbi:hypothetical protein C7B61_09190 [filamentous cyanobacterium CCP1]|nr:hypothetical protein C7B76_23145 [filamentous cyanobacterium CCP2]PSB66862.1 hypothetical protein C7B61_09190 [filamentous cyanobacterium CCP1]